MDDFENFLRFERQLSEATVRNYLYFLGGFRKFLAQDLSTPGGLRLVTQKDVSGFLSQLHARGVTKSSISLYIVAMRSYYKWAHYMFKDDNLGKVSFFLCNIVKTSRTFAIPAVPTKAEVLKLRQVLGQFLQLNAYDKGSRAYKDTLRAYAMIELLITAGLRSKELRGLRRKDVNLGTRIIFVKKGKGDFQRVSLFGESAVQILEEYFTVYHFADDDLIFQMVQPNVINRTIKTWAARAQINLKIHAHSFRHFFITESNRGGVPIEVIADQVGHRDLNSTRHYTHLDIEFIRQKYHEVKI